MFSTSEKPTIEGLRGSESYSRRRLTKYVGVPGDCSAPMEHPHPSIDVFGRSKERGGREGPMGGGPDKNVCSEEISDKSTLHPVPRARSLVYTSFFF